MYLRAEKYVSGYESLNSDEEQDLFTSLVGIVGASDFVAKHSPHAYVKVTVAYWRKANAIHGWFVNKVQGGVDECQPHDVSRAQLEELKEICEELLLARERLPETALYGFALAKLPPSEGFFFGESDIGPWFWEDVEDTVKQLEHALEMPADWSFEYRSSW